MLEEEAKANADERFSELAEGQTVQGTVRSLTPFGAFVDLNGADALLHISDMAWHRVADPAEVVSVGDVIEAKILKIDSTDPVKRRVAIGLKQLQPHPWESVPERFHLGDKVTGTVTREMDFGAFVELAPGIEGLIHISEMAWGKKVRKPSDIVKVGDTVESVILSIDTEQKRIGLGLKQALGDPWVEIVKTIHPGAVIEGPVSRMTKFGAFITIAEGVEGLVHISEITAERRLNHPSDVLRVGEGREGAGARHRPREAAVEAVDQADGADRIGRIHPRSLGRRHRFGSHYRHRSGVWNGSRGAGRGNSCVLHAACRDSG